MKNFFRFNELANIQPRNLTFCDGFVKIFVPRSKTDVYSESNYVYIAKLESKYCPVTILRKYIEGANLDLSSQLPLVRTLTRNTSGYSFRNGNLFHTRCREIFKTTLKPDSGYDPKEYGGATADVSNNASKEVSGRVSKLHGRWKTDKAKNMYVLETDYNRLSVTKYLGI